MDTVDIDTIDDEDVLKQMVCITFSLNAIRFLIKIELNFLAVASDGGFR